MLEAILLFVVSIVLFILIERYLLFYASWHYSLDYRELLDKVSFAIFIGSLILFVLLLIILYLYKKEVNVRIFLLIILSLSSSLSRRWIRHNLNLSRVSYYQGDYLKCGNDSIIGILNRWGNIVVPCEYQLIYRFFDNEIGSERFASYNKVKDSETCYLYLYDSGKQIGVENLQFSLESNVELFIQDNYGTLLEKWGCDSIHSTQFAYLDELRETREKAQKEIMKAEEEFYILSELAGYVKRARCPSRYYEDNEDNYYENYLMRDRFGMYKDDFCSEIEKFENESLKDARHFFALGRYDYAIRRAKTCHRRYDDEVKQARLILDSSFSDIMSSIGHRQVSSAAIGRAVEEVNSHRSSEKITVEHQRQLVPVQEWVPCGSCQGTGKCPQCNGTGQNFYNSSNPYEPCLTCGRAGRCVMCAGQGGHYQTFYR